VDAGLQGQSGVGVAQVVQPNRRQRRLLDRPAEVARHGLGVEGGTVLPREDEVGLAHARKKHLGGEGATLDFAVVDATSLAYEDRFDLVVSFNCLHWVRDQAAMLAGVARSLAPGGRTFQHFAGQGNVAGMVSVVEKVAACDAWRSAFTSLSFPWCFPDSDSYRRLVREAGLVPERVEVISRQMAHEGASALAGWLRTTWLPYLDRLPEGRREVFVDEIVAAYLVVRAFEAGRRVGGSSTTMPSAATSDVGQNC